MWEFLNGSIRMAKQTKQVKPTKKSRLFGISIPTKDQKILWSRAAGRCSIPDCRVKLTLDKSNGNAVTLGEMCHIVGEQNSKVNARGVSSMPLVQRNKYSNLILLCAHHHKIIDRYEQKYTIESLHTIKDEHELWVEETLSTQTVNPDELVYSKLIDHLSISLQLEQWNWFISNAVRQLVHENFIDAYDIVMERQLATIFPGTKPELEIALQNLMQSYIDYISQYLSFATLPADRKFYSPDFFYKKVHRNPQYHYYSCKHNLWARKNFILLCLYVVRVNEFADTVRVFSNPLFYVVRGKFIIIDELGKHLGEWGAMLLPDFKETQKLLQAINKEIQEFDRNNKEPRN